MLDDLVTYDKRGTVGCCGLEVEARGPALGQVLAHCAATIETDELEPEGAGQEAHGRANESGHSTGYEVRQVSVGKAAAHIADHPQTRTADEVGPAHSEAADETRQTTEEGAEQQAADHAEHGAQADGQPAQQSSHALGAPVDGIGLCESFDGTTWHFVLPPTTDYFGRPKKL